MECSQLTDCFNKPLLSICIPTYNRAELLRECLAAVGPQATALVPHVELVVSDNCSSDGTQAVVREAAEKWPVRYSRSDSNLGPTANFIRVAELARGEYAWLVGDDDLVTAGSVEHLLGVLQGHPEVDFVFANTSWHPPDMRSDPGGSVSPLAMLERIKCRDPHDHPVDTWEELVDIRVEDTLLIAIMCLVFRRQRWLDGTGAALYKDPRYSRIVPWFGQAMLLAVSMIGRPAYYVARPCTTVFWGQQEWSPKAPYLFGFILHDLVDFYAEAGVPARIIDQCRNDLLTYHAGQLHQLHTERLFGYEEFSPLRFAWRFRRYPIPVLHALLPIFRHHCPKPLYRAGQGVVRAVRSGSRARPA